MKKLQIISFLGLGFFLLISNNSNSQVFTKIEASSVINDTSDFRSASWVDYNNDNHLDLFVATWRGFNNFLYSNNGNGTFTKILMGDVVTDMATSYGGIWGDYNNDGNIDLFVPNFNFQKNYLYANNGDSSFTKITFGNIITDEADTRSACWGDFNNDGFLDLFVANGNNQNNNLFVNNHNGTFTKVTSGIIVQDGGNSFSCSWADFDNDQDLDLFVANRHENNFLYTNNGDDSFTKQFNGPVVNDGGVSNSGSWGDYDNDGDLDLFVANGDQFNNTENILYENLGNGNFFKKTNCCDIVTDKMNSWDSSWGDYDNDGDLDIFVANYDLDQNNELYSNNGDGTFTKVNSNLITNDKALSRSCVWGDYDNDGDLDLFISNGFETNLQPNFLYINNGNNNNWINLKCIGSISNSSALGTIIKIKAQINGNFYWQFRDISSQTGNRSQNSLNVEFGLGDAPIIDSLVVYWPSGLIQILTDLDVNQMLTLAESNAQNVNDKIAVQSQLIFFDLSAHNLQFNLHIQNTSSDVFFSPLIVQFVTLESDPPGHAISVSNSDGGGNGVGAFYDYSNSMGPDNKLSPGEFTDDKTWVFNDPDDVNFFFSANVLASQMAPALFTKSANANTSALQFYVDVKNLKVNLITDIREFRLFQNYPNPFNPRTTIEYSIPTDGKVTIALFDVLGRVVETFQSIHRAPGTYFIIWNGRNINGFPVQNGIYFYRITFNGFSNVGSMVLLK